jgi:hypothetical protein
MTSLVIPTAVQVRLHWFLYSIPCFNVLGGIVGGGYGNSQAHADALGTAVLGRFTSSGLKALSASTTILTAVGIRDIRVANQVEFVSSAAEVAGTGSGDGLPNQLAAVVTLRTALAGKSYRGRAYFGGANEAQNNNTGAIEAAYNTALVSFMTGVQTDMATEGITLAVLSRPRTSPPFPVAWGGAATPVSSIVTRDTQWDTQRRRRD